MLSACRFWRARLERGRWRPWWHCFAAVSIRRRARHFPELGFQTLNTCRAALLLAALTCSAHAAELVSFSADHVTIKIDLGYVDLDRPDITKITVDHEKEQEMPKALTLANLFCGAYGKNPHEIITEHEYIEAGTRPHSSSFRYDIIHYACNDPEWWGLFGDKE